MIHGAGAEEKGLGEDPRGGRQGCDCGKRRRGGDGTRAEPLSSLGFTYIHDPLHMLMISRDKLIVELLGGLEHSYHNVVLIIRAALGTAKSKDFQRPSKGSPLFFLNCSPHSELVPLPTFHRNLFYQCLLGEEAFQQNGKGMLWKSWLKFRFHFLIETLLKWNVDIIYAPSSIVEQLHVGKWVV